MPKPMDIMPKGWSKVVDLDIMRMIDNIRERTGISLRVIENTKMPKGKVGRFIVQRRHPDHYSTIFMFEDEKIAFAWLNGADSFISLMRLEPAKIVFI